MVRYRTLSKKGNRFELASLFDPGQNDDDFIFGDRMGCRIVFDFSRKENKITVSPLHVLELPPLDRIQEELLYLFNIIKSLSPYESQTQKVPEDISPLSY